MGTESTPPSSRRTSRPSSVRSRGIWPTEAFFFPGALAEHDVTVEEVARFIGDYRAEDNVTEDTGDFGSFEPDDRVFDMAIPSDLLEGGFEC